MLINKKVIITITPYATNLSLIKKKLLNDIKVTNF